MEQVKKEIIAKAENEAKEIMSVAKEKAQAILDEANANIKEIEAKKSEETEILIDSIKKRELSQANLAARKEVMQTKKEVLDKVFTSAIDSIQSMKDSDKKSMIKKIFDAASKEIDVEYVYCTSEDIKLVPSGKHKILAKKMIGGLVLTSKDQSIILDYSYDTMIENIRKKNLQEISAILF